MPTKRATTKKRTAHTDSPLPDSPTARTPSYGRYETIARTWMWVGVAVFTLLIGGFWGWSLKMRLSQFSWGKSQEASLVSKTKQDWADVNDATKPGQLANELEKIKIQKALDNLIAAQVTAAEIAAQATATTTSSTVATSTEQ